MRLKEELHFFLKMISYFQTDKYFISILYMRRLNRSKLSLDIRVGQIESRLGRGSVKQ